MEVHLVALGHHRKDVVVKKLIKVIKVLFSCLIISFGISVLHAAIQAANEKAAKVHELAEEWRRSTETMTASQIEQLQIDSRGCPVCSSESSYPTQ